MSKDEQPPHTPSLGSLVPSTPAGRRITTMGGSRVILRVVHEAVSHYSAAGLSAVARRHRIGQHEFHEADYQQLLRWLCAISRDGGPRTMEDFVLLLQRRSQERARRRLSPQQLVTLGKGLKLRAERQPGLTATQRAEANRVADNVMVAARIRASRAQTTKAPDP